MLFFNGFVTNNDKHILGTYNQTRSVLILKDGYAWTILNDGYAWTIFIQWLMDI